MLVKKNESKKYQPVTMPSWCLWPDLSHHARLPTVIQFDGLYLNTSESAQYWSNFFSVNSVDQYNTNIRQFSLAYLYFIKRVNQYYITDLKAFVTSFNGSLDPMINFLSFLRSLEFLSNKGTSYQTGTRWWYFQPKEGEAALSDYLVLLTFFGNALDEEKKLPSTFDLSSSLWTNLDFVQDFITAIVTYIKNITKVETILGAVYQELCLEFVPINITVDHVETLFQRRPALKKELVSLFNFGNIPDWEDRGLLHRVVGHPNVLQKAASGQYPLPSHILHFIDFPAIQSLDKY